MGNISRFESSFRSTSGTIGYRKSDAKLSQETAAAKFESQQTLDAFSSSNFSNFVPPKTLARSFQTPSSVQSNIEANLVQSPPASPIDKRVSTDGTQDYTVGNNGLLVQVQQPADPVKEPQQQTFQQLLADAVASTEKANGAKKASATKPLSLSAVAYEKSLAGRIPMELSPDGQLIAYTVRNNDKIQGSLYSPSGVSMTEGRVRRQLMLRDVESGTLVSMGDQGKNSWAPTWSPDGKKLAYFSDKNGVAQAWVWDRESKESRKVGSFIARPHYGFETMSWTPDGKKLLVERKPDSEPISQSREQAIAAYEKDPLALLMKSDLLLVDIDTEETRLLAKDVYSRKYSISPDGKKVAYTHYDDENKGSQLALQSCYVLDLESNESLHLAEGLALHYGREWEWSPKSDAIAFVTYKQDGGRLLLADLETQQLRRLGDNVPNLDKGRWGMKAPVWGPEAKKLFVSDDQKLWGFERETGAAKVVAEKSDWELRNLAPTSHDSAPWGEDGKALLVGRRSGDSGQTGVWRFDPRTGEMKDVATLPKWVDPSQLALRSSLDGKQLFFQGGGDRENRDELYRLDTQSQETTQLSQVSSKVEGGKGKTKIVSWKTKEGKELKGSLLLPPDYEGGPLPTVTFVYGGSDGTKKIEGYGCLFDGGSFDAHVLSTRGYAVFMPSAPFEDKNWLGDVSEAVISGVNAMVEQGYADPDRLALMGQSFGSLNAWGVLTKTDMFEAAVTSANVLHPDLTVGFQRDPGFYLEGQIKMKDSPEEDPQSYVDNSPVHGFSKISTPLLMVQGTEDGVGVSKFTAETLKSLGKDVELKIYQDEGHVIQSPENVIDFWQRRLDFLEKHMPAKESADKTA